MKAVQALEPEAKKADDPIEAIKALIAKQEADEEAASKKEPEAKEDPLAALAALLKDKEPEAKKEEADPIKALAEAIKGLAAKPETEKKAEGLPASFNGSVIDLTDQNIAAMSPDQINAAWDKIIAPQIVN